MNYGCKKEHTENALLPKYGGRALFSLENGMDFVKNYLKYFLQKLDKMNIKSFF